MQRLIEPPFLFTAIGLIALAAIWGTTLSLIAREKAASDRTTASLTSDIADTYEAQVVRALREIDHSLKLLRHELDRRPPQQALQTLDDKELLLPALLFAITVSGPNGNVIASNNSLSPVKIPEDVLRRVRDTDAMVVGLPRLNHYNEWTLDFARAVDSNDDEAGIVMVSVHAGYFVSGYDPEILGESGVLGILGTDGVFRAKRSGDELTVGDHVGYDALVTDSLPQGDAPARVQRNDWDGMQRYTIARKLFEFPVAIVVGLSEAEQFAAALRLERVYLWRAITASIVLLCVIGLLGGLSWRLMQARNRAMEERVEHSRQIEHLAFHDNLTGLPNRAYFSQLLIEGMKQARRYDRSLALLFLDLDRFKVINDSLGHVAGDELLQEVGRRLRESVRTSDIVARVGGDEFVVLLPQIRSSNQVIPVAEKILESVSRPFTLGGQEFRVTVSIGVTIFPGDGNDEQVLLKNADTAMYHAKEQGKNNFQFYSEELNTNSLQRLAMETALRRALERGEFRLLYQARRNMLSGQITGMEALLHWQHPDLGLIQPAQFIAIAEETGLILPIGRWMLRTACAQHVAWLAEGLPAITMAMNFSARQFIDESLVDDIRFAIGETGMTPKLLEIEISESLFMRDMQRTIRILGHLKEIGVRVAIDDFGTGYSSLADLHHFPIDSIKIHHSFIRDVVRNSSDRGLTEAIIDVGKRLSLIVVAEGVETADQHAFLLRHSCDEFQGSSGREAVPAEAFAQLIREQRRGNQTKDRPS
jgi:diguanylate cyclase (GGDEF)-like protein